jgi:hypothetical protein
MNMTMKMMTATNDGDDDDQARLRKQPRLFYPKLLDANVRRSRLIVRACVMRQFLVCLLALFLLLPCTARAEDYVITLKDQAFTPREIAIPADRKVTIKVRNLDHTSAVFQSWGLNRKLRIDARSEITVYLRELDPGRYEFYDGYARLFERPRRDTTFGFITVKEEGGRERL